jgi:hypothetical protein
MSPHFKIMPVDKTVIRTRLRFHPNLISKPEAFILQHDLTIRTVKSTDGSKSTRNITLDVLTYKGIKVELSKTSGVSFANTTIHFNPGVCLYGHNGIILSLTEFIDALGLLVTHLKPLLADPADWADLIPGARRGGVAYWSYLEVPFQRVDPDGTVLSSFRHARHPSIRTPTRHWPTSLQIGGYRSKLQFSIYRKAIEMLEHHKLPESVLPDYQDVLRLEARMKEEKLVLYFGSGHNVELIEGKERLTGFYPQDLIRGHRDSFSEMEGVYSFDDGSEEIDKGKPLAATGRFLASMALDSRTTQTLPELMAIIKFYTGADSDSETFRKIRKAAVAELSRHSSLSRDVLLSDSAYSAQHGIASEEIENKVGHETTDIFANPSIYSAYSPPDQPFNPLILWPGYLPI